MRALRRGQARVHRFGLGVIGTAIRMFEDIEGRQDEGGAKPAR